MCFNLLTIDDQEVGSISANTLEIHQIDQAADEAVGLILLFVFSFRSMRSLIVMRCICSCQQTLFNEMEEIENTLGTFKPRWRISTRTLGLSISVCLFLILFLAQGSEKFNSNAVHLFISIDFINGGNGEFIWHLQTTLADFYENTWFIWSCLSTQYGQQVRNLIKHF